MKHVFTILALLGAVAIGSPAWADETPAGVSATIRVRDFMDSSPWCGSGAQSAALPVSPVRMRTTCSRS